MSACTWASCQNCGRCSEAWERDDERDEEQAVPDPIGMAERDAYEAVTTLRESVGRCETVAQVLALKVRISALWLAWDSLDQDVLRKADALLKEAVELQQGAA